MALIKTKFLLFYFIECNYIPHSISLKYIIVHSITIIVIVMLTCL